MENIIKRGFTRIEEGQVHFRYTGDFRAARPLVMLHASPASSITVEPLMRRLAGTRPIIAPDTLGNGDSAPAFQKIPDIEDYAEALGRILDALGIEEVDLYGTHTGASIAAELAIAQPKRVRNLLIDGIGLYAEDDLVEILANYAPAIEPDPIASHLNWAWHFVRDQQFFFPWFRRNPEHRRNVDVAPIEWIHGTVLDVLKSITTYHHAYRAAFRHPKRQRLPMVGVPSLIFGEPTDPLGVMQDEVCALVPGGRKADLTDQSGGSLAAKATEITRFLDRDGTDTALAKAAASEPSNARATPAGHLIDRDFVDVTEGQLHIRRAGPANPKNPVPLILLQSSPYSARTLEPLINALSKDRLVIAPDLPGLADSSPLSQDKPGIGDFAEMIGRALDALGIDNCDIYGTHTGGTIGMELSIARPELVRRLIIDGIGFYTPEFQAEIIANYAPEIALDEFGSHIFWAWHFVRDHSFFWPWYMRDQEHLSPGAPPAPDIIHANTVDLLKGIGSYHHAFRATFSHPKKERLPEVTVPTMFIGRSDNIETSNEAKASALVPGAKMKVVPAGDDAIASKAAAIIEFTAG
jgi:pimeloyl-ACP methyl ester carboxylesterase